MKIQWACRARQRRFAIRHLQEPRVGVRRARRITTLNSDAMDVAAEIGERLEASEMDRGAYSFR
jgi:hypothetical protein